MEDIIIDHQLCCTFNYYLTLLGQNTTCSTDKVRLAESYETGVNRLLNMLCELSEYSN